MIHLSRNGCAPAEENCSSAAAYIGDPLLRLILAREDSSGVLLKR
jgi:hypothetical protein